MLHSIFKHSLSKKQHVKKKYLVGFVCVGIVLISFLIYTVIFLRDTNTVEKCLAYPYANASQLKKIENETAEENCCVAYLSMQNDDGIQEMYFAEKQAIFRNFGCTEIYCFTASGFGYGKGWIFPDAFAE